MLDAEGGNAVETIPSTKPGWNEENIDIASVLTVKGLSLETSLKLNCIFCCLLVIADGEQ